MSPPITPHLTLLHCDEQVDEGPVSYWLAGQFHDALPFDQLTGAMEMFIEHYDEEPDIVYVNPKTNFWLSLVWSNLDSDGELLSTPEWAEMDQLMSAATVAVVADVRVPAGWWHLVRSVSLEVDLIPWS